MDVLELSPCQFTLSVDDLCLRRRARIGLPTAFRRRNPLPVKDLGDRRESTRQQIPGEEILSPPGR